MRIIFCESSLNPGQPDKEYGAEAEAARELKVSTPVHKYGAV